MKPTGISVLITLDGITCVEPDKGNELYFNAEYNSISYGWGKTILFTQAYHGIITNRTGITLSEELIDAVTEKVLFQIIWGNCKQKPVDSIGHIHQPDVGVNYGAS